MDWAVEDVMIVVLGCRPGPAGDLVGAARRRVETAAGCFHQLGGQARVVCSGGRAWEGEVEADAFARGLVAAGVPAASISRERCSMSTVENARYAASVRERLGRGPAIRLVTCDWHMARAARHFRGAGFEVIPVPATRLEPFGAKVVRGGIHALRELVAGWLDEVLR